MSDDRAHSGHRLRRAGALFGAQEVATRLVTIGLSLASARIVGPAEVGLLGFAIIVMALQSTIASFAETAAVYLPGTYGSDTPARLASRLRGFVTLVFIAVTFGLAPWLCRLFAVPEASGAPLVRLLLVLPVLEALGSRSRVLLQRRLQLVPLARVQVSSVFGYGVLGFLGLLSGLGVWGLAFAQIVATSLSTVWLVLIAQRFEPEASPPSEMLTPRRLVTASLRLFWGGFGGFLGERLDSLLVARTMGATALGIYSTAWSASRLAANVLVRAVNSTLGPAVAQLGAATPEAQALVRRSYRLFYWLAGLFTCLAIAWAPVMIPLILGPRWTPAIAPLQIMSLSGLVVAPMVVSGLLLTASGAAQTIVLGSAAHLSILALLVPPFASRWGLPGAAVAEELATLVLAVTLYALVRQRFGEASWLDWRAVVAVVVGLMPLGAVVVGMAFMKPSGLAWPTLGAIVGTSGYLAISLRGAGLYEDLRLLLERRR